MQNASPNFGWNTSVSGAEAGPSPAELAELLAHVKQCRRARGRMFRLRSSVSTVSEIIAHRFWTTVTLIALLLLYASLVFAG